MTYPVTVKKLIEELQQCDQDAVVIYPFSEYGRSETHRFIAKNDGSDFDDFIVLDENYDRINDPYEENGHETPWITERSEFDSIKKEYPNAIFVPTIKLVPN